MKDLNESLPLDGGRKWKVVYTIVERGGGGSARDGGDGSGAGGDRDRNVWLRIGIAWINRDGSLNVKLDAMPVNGTLHIRDPQPVDEDVVVAADPGDRPPHREVRRVVDVEAVDLPHRRGAHPDGDGPRPDERRQPLPLRG